MTRAAALAAQQQRAAERDHIQANLLELEASFGKRLLEGGSLTGTTNARWQEASADLATVWETFHSYSEIVRRAGDMLDGARRPSGSVLAQVSDLLTGPAVRLSGGNISLPERQLTGRAQATEELTLAAAVQRMTAAFSRITSVIGATESVWNEMAERLDEISALIATAGRQADEAADIELTGALQIADTELRRIRGVLGADPLSLWHDDGVDTTAADLLLRQARAAGTRAQEVARLKEDAARRIASTAARVAAAQACEADAAPSVAEAMQKIASGQLPAPPAATAQLASRLAGLTAIRAAGAWQRLAADLEAIDNEAAAAATQWRRTALAAQALLDQHSELRGLLDAYRAKAARHGGAENLELTVLYQRARDLLRATPCDLAAADDAARRYQHAVLGLSGGAP